MAHLPPCWKGSTGKVLIKSLCEKELLIFRILLSLQAFLVLLTVQKRKKGQIYVHKRRSTQPGITINYAALSIMAPVKARMKFRNCVLDECVFWAPLHKPSRMVAMAPLVTVAKLASASDCQNHLLSTSWEPGPLCTSVCKDWKKSEGCGPSINLGDFKNSPGRMNFLFC